MGLAASQARFLLLTARKNDLEYRSQMISHRRLMLATQTEELAIKYSKALSNRKLTLTATDSEDKTVQLDLSFKNITEDYLIQNSSKKFVITGKDIDTDWNTITNIAGISGEDEASRIAAVETDEEKSAIIQEYIEAGKVVPTNGLENEEYFQNALRNGTFYVCQKQDESYVPISWDSLAVVNDVLDTSDDASAQAEYEAQTLVLKNQDTMLDLELKQIDTQHNAVQTEIDSVKKVIEENIKSSFKIFG
jgi:hypothetical protein